MNWYYAKDGQQVGPLSDADFDNLVKTGAIQSTTLVWHEGMTDWKPFREVRGPAAPVTGDGTVCVECGRSFAPDELIQFGESRVCAECKPIFLQKIKEGAAVGAGTGYSVSVEQVMARDFEVSIGDCLSRGWELFKANFGSILAAVLLVFGIMIAISIIPFGIGSLAGLILQGPLMGGLYLFYLKKVRGAETTVGDAFGGFGKRFVNLMLAYIVSTILAGLCLVPAVVVGVMIFFGHAMSSSGQPPSARFLVFLLGPVGVLFVLGLCGMWYLQTCWLFTVPLVADKRLGFWEAMKLSRGVVTKHWWMTFLFLFVTAMVGFSGIIACGLGLLVTGPLAFGMTVYLYEKAFGDLAPVSL